MYMTSGYSSNDFAHEKFPPHGTIEVLSNGAVVHSRAEGPFNLEAILANNRARLEFLRSNPHINRFVNLAIIHKSVLASREALQAHREGLRQAYINNFLPPAAVAWVAVGDVEGFDLLAHAYIANFAAVDVPLCMFRDPALAEAWLAEYLVRDEEI